jgi:hypothetical protein
MVNTDQIQSQKTSQHQEVQVQNRELKKLWKVKKVTIPPNIRHLPKSTMWQLEARNTIMYKVYNVYSQNC